MQFPHLALFCEGEIYFHCLCSVDAVNRTDSFFKERSEHLRIGRIESYAVTRDEACVELVKVFMHSPFRARFSD